jgi:hypothetical protein
MAQTTEERIAQIAQGFGQGIQNFQQGQNQKLAQANQAEATRRQQAMQELEIEGKLSEQTGKNLIGSGIGKQYLTTGMAGIGELMGTAPKTRKAELEDAAKVRQGVLDQSTLDYQKSQTGKNNAEAARKSSNPLLTDGEKKVDADYAKDINDWTAVGKSNLSKNLVSLKEARTALDEDTSLVGGLTGVLPDRLTANRVLGQRQRVGSAVQGSLRATLGSSFTESEGNRTLANSYNEAADAETNKASLDKLITELEAQATVNDQRAEHFRKNGTLKGFAPQIMNQKEAPSGSGPWNKNFVVKK